VIGRFVLQRCNLFLCVPEAPLPHAFLRANAAICFYAFLKPRCDTRFCGPFWGAYKRCNLFLCVPQALLPYAFFGPFLGLRCTLLYAYVREDSLQRAFLFLFLFLL
jgi:hypothetical protein